MDLNNKEKLIIALAIVVFAFIGWINKRDEVPMEFVASQKDLSDHTKEDDPLELEVIKKVHITGEIKYPGVYEFEEGDRLNDLILDAGGLLETADEKAINLAKILEDEMKIHIPHIDEEEVLVKNENPMVNIRTADIDELKTLPGIGDKKAESILQFREDHGFEELEDLMHVPGIGKGIFDRLKDQIVIK
ncbi:MAG: ComEA family DNA-binding protein [Tissierellia bacterium]|nr:ComEA family DNA-binding protein [Tissierellia bacterium]